jgi:hypothetical protein
MGRLLYLTPLYTDLKNNGFEDVAQKYYKQNEAFYSPIARNMLQALLGNAKAPDAIEPTYKNNSFKRVRY